MQLIYFAKIRQRGNEAMSLELEVRSLELRILSSFKPQTVNGKQKTTNE